MATSVSGELSSLADRVGDCGRTAGRLIRQGLSSDIQLVVKRKFGVRITSSTARKIMAAIELIW